MNMKLLMEKYKLSEKEICDLKKLAEKLKIEINQLINKITNE